MFAEVNGCKLYYEIAGSGRPVLTMHGGPGIGDHQDNKKMFGDFEDLGQFIYYDMRGNGKSSHHPPETYTHEFFCQDAESLRQHLELGMVAIGGGSYGGILALEYALRYQRNVTRILLRGTAASYELQTAAIENALAKNLDGVDRPLLERLFYGQMKDDDDFRDHFAKIFPLYSTTYDPSRLKELLAKKVFHSATHNAVFRHEFPKYDIRERLHEIKVPVLIMAGRHDWITPATFAEELAELLPNAQLEIFEDSGHMLHRDEPERFKRVITDFLNQD